MRRGGVGRVGHSQNQTQSQHDQLTTKHLSSKLNKNENKNSPSNASLFKPDHCHSTWMDILGLGKVGPKIGPISQKDRPAFYLEAQKAATMDPFYLLT